MIDASTSWGELPADTRDAVLCVLSRAVLDNRDLRLQNVAATCLGLAAWGSAELTRRGVTSPAPFPEMPRGGYRSGTAVMNALGTNRDALGTLWNGLKQRWHEEARLEEQLLAEFVPRPLWLVAARLLEEGPDLAGKRLAAAIDQLCEQPVRVTKARPDGGTMSASAIGDHRDRMMTIMGWAVRLRADLHPSPALAPWTHRPARPEIHARTAVTDRTAPSRRLCRLVFDAYRKDVLSRLRCDTLEQLPEQVRSMPRYQLQAAWCFHTFRMLTMLVILLLTGSRRHAMVRLRRGDVQFARIGWDGIPRVALGIRPAKGKPADDIYYKALPRPAGCVIEAWLIYVERMATRPVSDSDPLLISSLGRPDRAPDLEGLTTLFSGYIDREPGRKSRRAAFPRFIDCVPSIGRRGPYSDRECVGYSPHTLRHAADQLVEHGAREYLNRLGEHRLNGTIIVKAMCNHSMAEDPHHYKDFANPQGLERLCCMGAEITWAVLTTDDGARLALDREALERAMRARAAIERDLDDLRDRIREARTRLQRGIAKDPSKLTHSDWVASQVLRSSIDTMWDERSELREALRDVDREIDVLRHDPRRRVAVPDELPDEACAIDVDALQLAVDGTRTVDGRRARRRREWLTPAEFAAVAGTSESEVKRWLAGKFSTRHKGPLPWPSDSVPQEWISPRRRRIHVEGVNPDFLADADRLARLERVLAKPLAPQAASVTARSRAGATNAS